METVFISRESEEEISVIIGMVYVRHMIQELTPIPNMRDSVFLLRLKNTKELKINMKYHFTTSE